MLKLENVLKSSRNLGKSLLLIGVLTYGCANDSALITTPTSIPTNARPPSATASPRPENVETTISYIDAINDITKRQGWLDEVIAGKKPDYVVSVQYATPAILRELEDRLGYRHPEGAFAVTIPENQDEIGKGVKSRVYVFDDAFVDMYKQYPQIERNFPKPQLYDGLGIIVDNVILRNEFTDAKHFNQGIPGYPLDLFVDSDGNINKRLYTIVIDLLSNSSEFKGLMQNPETRRNRYIHTYANTLADFSNIYYQAFSVPELTRGMDNNFINALRTDFNLRKLFPN